MYDTYAGTITTYPAWKSPPCNTVWGENHREIPFFQIGLICAITTSSIISKSMVLLPSNWSWNTRDFIVEVSFNILDKKILLPVVRKLASPNFRSGENEGHHAGFDFFPRLTTKVRSTSNPPCSFGWNPTSRSVAVGNWKTNRPRQQPAGQQEDCEDAGPQDAPASSRGFYWCQPPCYSLLLEISFVMLVERYSPVECRCCC